MICGIDPEYCGRGFVLMAALSALGTIGLALALVGLLYLFKEIIIAAIVLISVATFLWSVGLFQIVFVLSFVPSIIYFSAIANLGLWRSWRRWQIGAWIAGACFIAAIAVTITAHEDTKTIVALLNANGLVFAVWGCLVYFQRYPSDPATTR